MLQSLACNQGAFGSYSRTRWGPRRHLGRGCSSGVEHHVANVRVEGSNPFARSNSQNVQPGRRRRSNAVALPSSPARARRTMRASGVRAGLAANRHSIRYMASYVLASSAVNNARIRVVPGARSPSRKSSSSCACAQAAGFPSNQRPFPRQTPMVATQASVAA